MDNAPYHSRKMEKIPNTSTNKGGLISWLESKNVEVNKKMKRRELLELVNGIKPTYDKYIIDEMARAKGVTVLRLPPYHCIFNPIELIWAKVRNYPITNKSNKLFSITNKQCAQFSILKIKNNPVNVQVGEMIINFNTSSDEDDTDDDDDYYDDIEVLKEY